LVDGSAPPIPREDVTRVFTLATSKLEEKTGQWMRLVDIVYGYSARSFSRPDQYDLVMRYLKDHPSNLPDGILLFSVEEPCKHGGFSFAVKGPGSFVNEFPSPRPDMGRDKVYVAMVEFNHRYALCGYDDNRAKHISDVSVDGECRNQPGLRCEQQGDFWVCPNTFNDLYADHDYFIASGIIHEFLHPFGMDPEGGMDHYGSTGCNERTGMKAKDFDLRQAQLNFVMCPDIFPRFRPSR
jgi:hypothetical protein